MPTRIIDTTGDRVRLHEAHDELGQYACLSHCWGQDGTSKRLCTTNDTLAAFKQEIPWLALPKTFQDAINITRRLGIRFIWIDSLCIIQDNALDWQRESAEMASIYKNSYVTIGATHSVNSDGGCYTPAELSRHDAKTLALTSRDDDGQVNTIYARVPFFHEMRNQSFPLLDRGWVLQERLLSPRILHFAGYELVWECTEGVHCECASPSRRNFSFSRSNFGNYDPTGIEKNGFPAWREVVRNYSILALSYPSDAFPALSGIVKEFARVLDDHYQAGLWTKTFVSDLVWSWDGQPLRCRKAMPWRAPSWSWLSVDFALNPKSRAYSIDKAGICYHAINEPLAQVVSVRCCTKGSDPTGELSSALLVLRARAVHAALVVRPRSTTTTDDPLAPAYQWSISIPHFEIGGSCRAIGAPLGDLGMLTTARSSRYKCDLEYMENQPNVHVVLLGRNNLLSRWGGHDLGPVFMVLSERSDEPGTWERIGLLQIPERVERLGEWKETEKEKDWEKAISTFDTAPVMEFAIV
jgi:hypothetical protein